MFLIQRAFPGKVPGVLSQAACEGPYYRRPDTLNCISVISTDAITVLLCRYFSSWQRQPAMIMEVNKALY